MLMLIAVHSILANCQNPSALGIVSFNGNHCTGGGKGLARVEGKVNEWGGRWAWGGRWV